MAGGLGESAMLDGNAPRSPDLEGPWPDVAGTDLKGVKSGSAGFATPFPEVRLSEAADLVPLGFGTFDSSGTLAVGVEEGTASGFVRVAEPEESGFVVPVCAAVVCGTGTIGFGILDSGPSKSDWVLSTWAELLGLGADCTGSVALAAAWEVFAAVLVVDAVV